MEQNLKENKRQERLKLNKAAIGKLFAENVNLIVSKESLRGQILECQRSVLERLSSSQSSKLNLNGSKNSSANISQKSRNVSQINSNVHISVNTQDKCNLSEWGLPPSIYEKYEKKGVTKMFPWQVECLANKSILESNKNLIYSAPTSAGKTLVSEILMLKSVLEQKKKAIFILPFVSVVREKMFYFQDLLSGSGVRVEGFMGNVTPAGGFSSVNIAIATIEKANSLINRLIEEKELSSLGILVIDELHLLGDPSRGYLLELLLTKLKYAALKSDFVKVQLIGMSATLPNLSSLAKWLDAELYKTDFRPIPLTEHCKVGPTLYDNQLNPIRTLSTIPELPDDVDDIFQLCLETIKDGHGTLIFCPTKNWCEKLALQIAGIFAKIGNSNSSNGVILREKLDTNLIMETLEQLKRCPIGLDGVLKNTVSFGVAFHHAGLTLDERDIIEGAFRVGSVKVLTATSTLSSGVNLPARRVIVRSPMFNRQVLDTLVYRQMIGRAGRMGKDTAGESILICKPSEKPAAKTLLSASLDAIESCLEGSGRLLRTLLEAIASQMVRTTNDMEQYLQCTFAVSCDEDNLKDCASDAIKFLMLNEFITSRKSEEGDEELTYLEATHLGKACLAAAISPRDGLYLFEELQKARRCMALDSELHILYLVTPYDSGGQIGQIDWMNYMEIYKSLEESERRIGSLVGVEERFLISAITGRVPSGKQLNIHRRFYTALALHELIREVPLHAVCRKFNCCRGMLQSLQQSSATLAGMVTQFCKELGWSCMELLVSQFQPRLQFGVGRDLLDLLRLSSLNGIRARSLFKEGIKTVADLASASERDVERALHKAIPFESAKENMDDKRYNEEMVQKQKMRTIFITGRDGLTAKQASVILIQEARDLIQRQLGVDNVKWQTEENVDILSESQASTVITSRNQSTVFSFNDFVDPSSQNVQSLKSQTASDLDSPSEKNNSVITSNRNLVQSQPDRVSIASFQDEDIFAIPANSTQSQRSGGVENSLPGQSESTQQDMFDTSNLASPDRSNQNETISHHEEPPMETSKRIDVKSVRNPTEVDRFSGHLLSGFLNSFNEPTKSVLKNCEKSVMDSIDLFMEEIPTMNNSIFPANTQRKSSTAQQENVTISFGSPWYDKGVPINKTEDEEFVTKTAESNVDKLSQLQLNELHKRESNKLVPDGDVFLKPPDVSKPCRSENSNKSKDRRRSSGAFNGSFDTAMCDILDQNVFEEEEAPKEEKPTETRSQKDKSQKGVHSLTWIDVSWSQLESQKISQKKVTKPNKTKSNFTPVVIAIDENPGKKSMTKQESSKLKLSTESNSFDNKIGRNQPTKRKLSGSLNTVEDLNMSMMSWHDTWDEAKRPKVSLQDEENLGNKSSELRSSLKERSIKSTDLENSGRSSDYPVTRSVLKRRLSIETANGEEILASSQGHARFKQTPSTSKSNKRIALGQKDQNVMKNLSREIIKEDRSTKIEQFFKSLSENGDKSQADADPIESCSNVTPRIRKSIYQKTDEEQTEEDFSFENIIVIKLEHSRTAFKLFKTEIEEQSEISLALACESIRLASAIGAKIIGNDGSDRNRSRRSGSYVCDDSRLCGVVVTWGLGAIYYMSLLKSPDDKVPIKERLSILIKILNSSTIKVNCVATKEVYKALYKYIGIAARCSFVDPKVATWILNPDATEKSFRSLVLEHFPKGKNILQQCDPTFGTKNPGLNVASSFSSFNRAVGEGLLTWYIMKALYKKLKSKNPVALKTFEEIEMKILPILARMELRGFGLNTVTLRELAIFMQNEMKSLENQAFKMAGRSFNFCSPKEVAQVLNLPTKGKISTGKSVLEKCDNPIASLIILWRKLNTTETKVIIPIINNVDNDSRIRGNSITHTVTGRVSMQEPNVQNVPKDFTSQDESKIFSLRASFVPTENNLLISADYCQLELRIMAHFSKDPILCKAIRNRNEDIFKSISSVWNNISIDQIDTTMRTRTKHLCYGMIYGMGTKTLAETLKVTEAESTEFLENFMSKFKGVRKWLGSVIEKARVKGYVTTIMGRRRHLPALYSDSQSEKSQAERQAVNTKVQGTAADVAKKAMILIEQRMRKTFPDADIVFPSSNDSRSLRSSSSQFRGGYLVLQLHDELIYEVKAEDLKTTAAIIKESMEKACKLDVPLPVKLKVGPTWGDLEEYNEL